MKKMGQNIVIFLILLGITYFYPVFFSSSKEGTESQPVTQMTPKMVQEKPQKATGVNRYIHRSLKSFEEKYGQTKYIAQNEKECFFILDHKECLIQLSVINDKITSILILGQQAVPAPFSLGMTLNQLSSKINLMTNFEIKYQQKRYQIEIPEDKLLLSPCVLFDNQSYALLQFDTKGILQGTYYCDVDKLVQNMPYRFINDSPQFKQGISQSQLTLSVWERLIKKEIVVTEEMNRQAKEELQKFIQEQRKEEGWMNAFHYVVNKELVYPAKDFSSFFDREGLLLATHKDYQLELLQRFYDLNQHSILASNVPLRMGLYQQGSVTLLFKEEDKK